MQKSPKINSKTKEHGSTKFVIYSKILTSSWAVLMPLPVVFKIWIIQYLCRSGYVWKATLFKYLPKNPKSVVKWLQKTSSMKIFDSRLGQRQKWVKFGIHSLLAWCSASTGESVKAILWLCKSTNRLVAAWLEECKFLLLLPYLGNLVNEDRTNIRNAEERKLLLSTATLAVRHFTLMPILLWKLRMPRKVMVCIWALQFKW